MEYFNEDFEPQTRVLGSVTARMIQHEYDHTEGILYLDYLKPLTKRLLESKLKKNCAGKNPNKVSNEICAKKSNK